MRMHSAAAANDGDILAGWGPVVAVGAATAEGGDSEGGSGGSDASLEKGGGGAAAAVVVERPGGVDDIERAVGVAPGTVTVGKDAVAGGGGRRRLVPVYGVNRPFFHIDVATAVKSAVRNIEGRGGEDG